MFTFLAWAGWSIGNITALVGPPGPVPSALYVASYAAGASQYTANAVAWGRFKRGHRHQRERDEELLEDEGALGLQLQLVPTGTIREPGLALTGTW